jgi:hypothetical protein
MKHTTYHFKKLVLIALVLTISIAAMPISVASATGLKEDGTPPVNPQAPGIRLEVIWERQQSIYDRQGILIDRAEPFLDKIQTLIDRANQNGKDSSGLQAALDVLAQAVKDAKPIHQSANGIIASHKGFDENGNVTDRAQALETTESLRQYLNDVRTLIQEPFKLLHEAVKAFRDGNRPTLPKDKPSS